MHQKFYINDELTQLEEINQAFSSAEEMKEYLKTNKVECGYLLNCKAKLIPVFMPETEVLYLRSKHKADHLKFCPFSNLVRLKQQLIKNGSLNFLLENRTWKIRNAPKTKNNELIARQYDSTYLKLSELFELLKNDPELVSLREKSFIDPENSNLWYVTNHGIIGSLVLLTGVLNRKFFSCAKCPGKRSYDCYANHPPVFYKLEILGKDIEFDLSVSKEIYDSLIIDSQDSPKKSYHVLAQITEMGGGVSSLDNKRFYTKNRDEDYHKIKDKKFIELIE